MKLVELYKGITETVSQIDREYDSNGKYRDDKFIFFIDLYNIKEFSKLLHHDGDIAYEAALKEDYLVVILSDEDLAISLDDEWEAYDYLMELLDDYYKIFEQ